MAPGCHMASAARVASPAEGRAMQKREFPAGQTIFAEGDASGEAFIVRSGRVEILKAALGGQIRLAILGPGDVLGEMGLLEDRPRSATARTLDKVTVDAIARDEFLRLLLDEPGEALELLRALFERLRTVNQMLADADKESKIAHALPRVVIYPLNADASQVLPEGGLEVDRFPFRFGRVPVSREEKTLAFNDVELPDARPHRLSLNHFAVDLDGSEVVVRDRGSRQGTFVNGLRIGAGERRDQAVLKAGDNEVEIGAIASDFAVAKNPYRFKILVEQP